MLANALHIYQHLFAQHKVRVGAILAMSLLSQVCLLVSLILPWQILYVLSTGHSRMDSMLTTPMPAMLQLIWLSIIIALSFGLYVWLKHQSKVWIDSLADAVVRSLDKTKLMVNHQSIAHFTMGVIIRSLAAIVNWVIFTTIVLFLYPKLAIAVLFYMLVLALSISYTSYHSQHLADYQKLQDRLQQNSLLLTNLGIAVSFAVIVYDYTQQSLPTLVLTFIAVLVIRQALLAYINIALGLLGIKKRINNINLLFLSKEQQLGLMTQNDFEQQFYQKNLNEWLPQWMISRYPKALSIECVECKLFSKATVAYVVVRLTEIRQDKKSPTPYYLLLKCYHPTKESFAQHEIDFLTVFGTSSSTENYTDNLIANGPLSENNSILPKSGVPNPTLSVAGFSSKREDYNKKPEKVWRPSDIPVNSMQENKAKSHDVSLIPTFIASGKLEQGRYLLMDFHPAAIGQTLEKRRPYYAQIREHIYNLSVPNQLIEKFQRTHVDLAQRMRALDWSRLDYLHQDERDELRLDEMIGQWDNLIVRIERLPKTLTLDNLSTLRLAVCEAKPIVYCWQGWVFESLGAYWPISAHMKQEIAAVIESMKVRGNAALLSYIESYSEKELLEGALLAARLHNFCRNLQQKHNIDALNSLQDIFKVIEQ